MATSSYKVYNRVKMTSATTGTGTVTLGSASTGYTTFAEGGVPNAGLVTYLIEEGSDFEVGRGTYTSSGTTLSRDTVLISKISGTAGTSKMNLAGAETISIVITAEETHAPTGLTSLNEGPLAGYRNRLINGGMSIWQRSATSISDDTYAFDMWNNLTQTAATTLSQLTDVENTTPYMMRITQGQASAQRFGTEQMIEALNCKDLRGQNVTLSARVRCSNSTTLRYAILEWTGTADSITSDFVNDWTNGTFTAGQFFTSTSTTVTATGSTALSANTLTTVSLSATLGSSLNNLVVIFWTDSTQAQNSTLDIGKVQLEPGSTATTFERRTFAAELDACSRYYFRWTRTNGYNETLAIWQAFSTTQLFGVVPLPVTMRITPTVAQSATGDIHCWNAAAGTDTAFSALAWDRNTIHSIGSSGTTIGTGNLVAGNATMIFLATNSGWIEASADL